MATRGEAAMDIYGIRRRCEAATPGDWDAQRSDYSVGGFHIKQGAKVIAWAIRWDDVRFITNAHDDIPALLAAYEEQAAEIERLKTELETAKGNADALSEMYHAAERSYSDTAKDRDDWKRIAKTSEKVAQSFFHRSDEIVVERNEWKAKAEAAEKLLKEESAHAKAIKKARAEEYEDRMRLEAERDEWKKKAEEAEKRATESKAHVKALLEARSKDYEEMVRMEKRLAKSMQDCIDECDYDELRGGK